MTQKPHSYIVCSTPRTGSTFLCSLLKATNLAGKPESYFRSQDVEARVEAWKIRQTDGSFSFSDFLNCVLRRGRTDNDVFAARIMWGTMEELTNNLRSIGMTGGDREVLSSAFGPTKFVYLKRQDLVAQAISRLRAEQTNVWHIRGKVDQDAARLRVWYDQKAIQYFVEEAKDHNQNWNEWFQRFEIDPLRLIYEDLDDNGKAEASKVLEFIGVRHPSFPKEVSNVRLADEISKEWADRFRVESGYSD